MESLEAFIYQYGYLAILIGAMVEGEASLLLGGLAALAGYLDLPWVIVVSFCGTLFADQAYFFLGRWHSRRILSLRPLWKSRMYKAEMLLERYRILLILLFHFFYGMRIVFAVVIGMGRISVWRFVVLNAFGAMLWAVTVGTAGYFFGSVFQHLMVEMKQIQLSFAAALAVTGSILYATRYLLKKRSLKN